MSIDFATIRATHSLAQFCRSRGMELHRNGPSGQFVSLCPFHSEGTPSFTIFPDNRVRCFGCGWHGDIVDFELALAGGSLLDAAARIGGAGVAVETYRRREVPTEKKIVLPDLEAPTEKDLARLSERRSIDVAVLAIAVDHGFLWAFNDERNGRCWVYTDERRQCAVRRRLDNQPFSLANGRETKAAACPGSKIKAPLGYREAKAFPCIAVQEGGPNSLAAIAHAWASGVEAHVAPICMPSTSSDFSSESLSYLQGKRARIFVDDDPPGMKAARRWAKQLRTADVIVDGYSFDGLLQDNGAPVNDLNDLLRIDVDSWDRHREVIESVMDFALERMP